MPSIFVLIGLAAILPVVASQKPTNCTGASAYCHDLADMFKTGKTPDPEYCNAFGKCCSKYCPTKGSCDPNSIKTAVCAVQTTVAVANTTMAMMATTTEGPVSNETDVDDGTNGVGSQNGGTIIALLLVPVCFLIAGDVGTPRN